jgi:hypothetical protein
MVMRQELPDMSVLISSTRGLSTALPFASRTSTPLKMTKRLPRYFATSLLRCPLLRCLATSLLRYLAH